MRAGNRAFWQRVAKIYGPVMAKSSGPLYAAVCDRIRPQLGRDMEVLELACGTGQLSYPLSRQVRRWEATDFSETMIAEAKRKGPPEGLSFSVQDATALPYGAGRFDAVVIANALHIMPDPERALAEIRRVLKPGGMLFAPTFVHGGPPGARLRVRLMALAGFRTYHTWQAEEFAAYVGGRGFVVLDKTVLRGGLMPLCCLVARMVPEEGSPRQKPKKSV